ncbi:MAG: UrcA family protein [Gammaproteobacteria bacterium]|nr:UrcA family protein [Gammaproteobacteria bacterium]
MKVLRTFVTFMSAFAIASAFGSGIAYGDEANTTKPTAEIDDHVYAFGDSAHVEKRSVKVSYADLNLNNEKGVAVLYRRLQVASESVCGVRRARESRSLRFIKIAEDCYEESLSRAVDDAAGFGLLLTLHQGTEPPEIFATAPK